MATRESTDMGPGLATFLSMIAAAGAGAAYLSPGGAVAGWGFAVAMVAASLAVVVIHAYG